MAIFSEAFTRLREDFDQAHENRLKLIRDIRGEVHQQAEQTKNRLAEQGKDRHAEFNASIRELRSKVRQQAEQTRSDLAELAADLRDGGTTFHRR